MRQIRLENLSPQDVDLIRAAELSSRNAYAPYSGFAVGAAVRTIGGAIHTGANLENASYGVTMCAEVGALTGANGGGDFRVEALAVMGFKFVPPIVRSSVVTPCGRCRQMILEAAQISGIDVSVYCCSGDLARIEVMPISELLPHGFGPENLGLETQWPKMQAMLRAAQAPAQSPQPMRRKVS